MNARYFRYVLTAIAVLPFAPAAHAADIGTAFTYQGFLEKPAGTPVGLKAPVLCDFEFTLWDDGVPGAPDNQVGPTLTFAGLDTVPVTDGVFTVLLDFGGNAINGQPRWLGIKVCCPSGCAMEALAPRVELTPAPYSIRAGEGVGGPNALNVTPSGDVGIGTTTPAARLDVNGAARTTTLEITGGSPLQHPLAGWGDNGAGQINVPVGTFVAVAGGAWQSLAIRSDGTLAGWGCEDPSSNYGQCNVPSGTFTAVAAGGEHSLAIRSDGTLAGWGCENTPYNFGQCNVPAGTFIAVAAGSYHSLAIRSDGTLVGWGCGPPLDYGQCNVPSGTFTALGAGAYHGLAIRSDGTLAGWGTNWYGETDVPAGTFTAVDAGYGFGLAIRSDGTLVGWGDNSQGQIDVPEGTFTAVAAGGSHGLAIRGDGTLVGWGYNNYGQTDVPAGTFTAVSGGSFYSLAIATVPPSFALLLANDLAAKPGSNTWTISSDRRLKKNIEPLSGALERLLQLRGVTFQWLDPSSQGGITGTQMGLIADEVSLAFPQWVGRDPKGYQTLTVGGFEALTAEALRELRVEKDRQLNEKDCEIAELREQMGKLEAAINALTAPSAGGGAWNVLKNDPWN